MSTNETPVEGRATTARTPTREPQRIVIRTAENRFDIPLHEIPEGMDYGWKVKYVLGKEAREDIINWKLNGWKEVPAGRHPSFTAESPDSQAEIERGGLVLCERPKEISTMSKEMDRQKASDQIKTQMDRLAGRARATGSERATKINQAYEPIVDDT